jgi:cytochrome P450
MHASGGNMSTPIDIRSEDFLDRPVECLAALRANAPACPVDPEGWLLITRHDLVRRILQDTEGFPTIGSKHSTPPADVTERVAALRAQGWPYTSALGTSNPPDHTVYRKMVNKSFTPRALQALEPLVRQAAADLARILPDGLEIDFQADFGEPLPVWAISRSWGCLRSAAPTSAAGRPRRSPRSGRAPRARTGSASRRTSSTSSARWSASSKPVATPTSRASSPCSRGTSPTATTRTRQSCRG